MTTLNATSQLANFVSSLNSITLRGFSGYESSIEEDLGGTLTYERISTAQMVVGASTGYTVLVDGTGLSIPLSSVLDGSASNLSWSNVGGTVQDVQLYQGGNFSNGAMRGGTLVLDATLSSTRYVLSEGGLQLSLTGSGLPTNAASFGSLLSGTYSGPAISLSSITATEGQVSATLSFNASDYTLTVGDYRAVLSGSDLPTSFTAAELEQLLQNQGTTALGGSITGITVTQISTGATVLSETGTPAPITLASLLSGNEWIYGGLFSNISTFQGTAASAVAVLDELDQLAYSGTLKSILLTDSGTPVLHLSGGQIYDSYALSAIGGNYQIALTNSDAWQVSTALGNSHVASISVDDSLIDIANALPYLDQALAEGKLTSITLVGSSPSNDIEIGGSQDVPVLDMISGDFTVTYYDEQFGTATFNGPAGHGTTVHMPYVYTSQAVVTSGGDGTSFTIDEGNGDVTHLSNVTALVIGGQTDIVAQTPGPANAVTTGNITELYSAVFAREPDVSGLAFYQNYLKANPTAPLLQFADYFLASTEYTSNAAHNYAQSTAGDAQFINDSYQNLLHRTPTASEVSFYQTNVLTPAEADLTPGTQAFATAQTQAHALMLVYFSASSEFLSDVQITAATPASAQHWLYLI